MSLHDTLNIDTPENVTFDYEIAGMGSRFAAALIDTIIVTVLQVVTNLLILLVIPDQADGGILESPGSAQAWVIALIGLVAFLFLWGYFIFFELLWNGQTPGKKALGLRVIRTDGTPITLTESLIRNLVRLVDFLPAFYGIGTIAIFVNRQTRRLGDLAAGTLVVREKNLQVSLNDLDTLHRAARSSAASAGAGDLPPTTFPIDRLTDADLELVERFFQRQKELVHADALARDLVKRLLAKMALEPGYDSLAAPQQTLQQILAEYRQARQ